MGIISHQQVFECPGLTHSGRHNRCFRHILQWLGFRASYRYRRWFQGYFRYRCNFRLRHRLRCRFQFRLRFQLWLWFRFRYEKLFNNHGLRNINRCGCHVITDNCCRLLIALIGLLKGLKVERAEE
jgi:hypothetical protein